MVIGLVFLVVTIVAVLKAFAWGSQVGGAMLHPAVKASLLVVGLAVLIGAVLLAGGSGTDGWTRLGLAVIASWFGGAVAISWVAGWLRGLLVYRAWMRAEPSTTMRRDP